MSADQRGHLLCPGPPPRTRLRCKRWSPKVISCCSTATITSHGALLLGGVPIFVETLRNLHGLIGPLREEALDEDRLRAAIRCHPLVRDKEAWRRPRPFRVAVIEQCTYDGSIHSAEALLHKIGHLCDYLLFDEAWAGFMKFHPLF